MTSATTPYLTSSRVLEAVVRFQIHYQRECLKILCCKHRRRLDLRSSGPGQLYSEAAAPGANRVESQIDRGVAVQWSGANTYCTIDSQNSPGLPVDSRRARRRSSSPNESSGHSLQPLDSEWFGLWNTQVPPRSPLNKAGQVANMAAFRRRERSGSPAGAWRPNMRLPASGGASAHQINRETIM